MATKIIGEQVDVQAVEVRSTKYLVTYNCGHKVLKDDAVTWAEPDKCKVCESKPAPEDLPF